MYRGTDIYGNSDDERKGGREERKGGREGERERGWGRGRGGKEGEKRERRKGDELSDKLKQTQLRIQSLLTAVRN